MNYRKGSKCLLAILLVFSFSSSAAAGKIYRWVDENGTVGFTDNPSSLPEKYQKTITLYGETEPGERPIIIEGTKPPQPTGALETPSDVDDNGHDEGWWKNRVRELKTRQDVLLQEKERLQQEYDTTYATWLNPFAPGNENIKKIEEQQREQAKSGKPVDPKLLQKLFSGLPIPPPEITKKLEELKKQIAQIDDELKDIEYDLNVGLPEEARKARALPGWLRE